MVVTEEVNYLFVHKVSPENTHKKTSHVNVFSQHSDIVAYIVYLSLDNYTKLTPFLIINSYRSFNFAPGRF